MLYFFFDAIVDARLVFILFICIVRISLGSSYSSGDIGVGVVVAPITLLVTI